MVFSRDVVFDESVASNPPEQVAEDPKKSVTPVDSDSEDSESETEEHEDTDAAEDAPAADPLPLRRSTRVRRPPSEWWKGGNAAVALVGSVADPVTYELAVSAPDGELWKAAMDSEMKSQLENKSWKLTKLPLVFELSPTHHKKVAIAVFRNCCLDDMIR
jgi:hypothetical protein